MLLCLILQKARVYRTFLELDLPDLLPTGLLTPLTCREKPKASGGSTYLLETLFRGLKFKEPRNKESVRFPRLRKYDLGDQRPRRP